MSWQATMWAANLPHDRVGHVPFRVLMLLADHAHDDGTSTWRSVSSIASTLQVSERTVHRAIRDLRVQRLIQPGDQRLVQHLPPNRRPVVYDLLLTSPSAAELPLDLGVTEMSGVTTDVASYKEEPPSKNKTTSRGNNRARVTPTCPDGHPLVDDRHCGYGCPPLREAVHA